MGSGVVCYRRWCGVGQIRVTGKVKVTAKVKSKVMVKSKVKVMPKAMVISKVTLRVKVKVKIMTQQDQTLTWHTPTPSFGLFELFWVSKFSIGIWFCMVCYSFCVEWSFAFVRWLVSHTMQDDYFAYTTQVTEVIFHPLIFIDVAVCKFLLWPRGHSQEPLLLYDYCLPTISKLNLSILFKLNCRDK